MKVVKITTKNGDVFYCKPGTKILVANHHSIGDWEYVEMSRLEFANIPATSESNEFFAS